MTEASALIWIASLFGDTWSIQMKLTHTYLLENSENPKGFMWNLTNWDKSSYNENT